MKNKKGIGNLLFIFMLVIGLLFLAFCGALFSGIFNNFMTEVTPVGQSLGLADNSGLPGSNLTQNANYILNPGNLIADSLNWVLGVSYIISLFLIIALAVSYRGGQEKWALAFFFLLIILALMLSIMMSNSYQDLYDGKDSLASGLHDQTLLSWLILYSPLVTIIVMLISALIMFSSPTEGGFVA